MLAHYLNSQPATDPAARADEIAKGVLAVLAGAHADHIAAELGMTTANLAEAIETYHQAGYAALEQQITARNWYQIHVQFPDWSAAETTAATDLGPQLRQLQDTGVVTGWWFIRKAPCWRLRLKPPSQSRCLEMRTAVNMLLDNLVASGSIERWRPTRYEPETATFGGPSGTSVAHELFCFDSAHILDYIRQPEPAIGRRELSVLLCTTLFRAANQDWFECGDIWHRVTRMRPAPDSIPAERAAALAENLRTLLTTDVLPTGALFGAHGPLAFAASWAAAFHQVGQTLAVAASEGALTRGTRDILAHHVIFHWNRLGLAATTQSILARAAQTAILD